MKERKGRGVKEEESDKKSERREVGKKGKGRRGREINHLRHSLHSSRHRSNSHSSPQTHFLLIFLNCHLFPASSFLLAYSSSLFTSLISVISRANTHLYNYIFQSSSSTVTYFLPQSFCLLLLFISIIHFTHLKFIVPVLTHLHNSIFLLIFLNCHLFPPSLFPSYLFLSIIHFTHLLVISTVIIHLGN